MRMVLAVAMALLAAPLASPAQADPVPGQIRLAQERKPGQSRQEAEKQARQRALIECVDKAQRPLILHARETARFAPLDAAVKACSATAPAGVSQKDVAETAATNLDRLLRIHAEAAELGSETVGTLPMPEIENSPEALCDAPAGLLRSCTDQEFEKLRQQMSRMWMLTPDWIQIQCQANSTFPTLFTCVQDWTLEWLATHPDARTPWVRPDLGDVPKR
jgi:hypothetical protein